MTRAEILAETLARLEAERFAPRPERPVDNSDGPSARYERATHNRRSLAEALGGDLYVVERSAS